jgi:hypothetical protein
MISFAYHDTYSRKVLKDGAEIGSINWDCGGKVRFTAWVANVRISLSEMKTLVEEMEKVQELENYLTKK